MEWGCTLRGNMDFVISCHILRPSNHPCASLRSLRCYQDTEVLRTGSSTSSPLSEHLHVPLQLRRRAEGGGLVGHCDVSLTWLWLYDRNLSAESFPSTELTF